MNKPTVQQPPPGQVNNPDPTAIQQAILAGFQQVAQQQQMQQPQQQLTPEQYDQMMGTYHPEMQLVHALFGADPERDNPRLEAFQQFVQGLITNAGRMAHVIADGRMRELYQHIQEPIEDARYLGQRRFMDELYDGHPGLKQFEPFIKQMLPNYETRQDYPRQRDQRAPWARQQIFDVLKQHDPNFDPTSLQQQQAAVQQHQQQRSAPSPFAAQQPTQPQQPRPASTPNPYTMGGGNGGGQPAVASHGGQTGQSARTWDTAGYGF